LEGREEEEEEEEEEVVVVVARVSTIARFAAGFELKGGWRSEGGLTVT